MATAPPTKADRDVNLELLKTTVSTWATQEQTRLENEVKFLRAVMAGRGASDTGTENLSAVSALLNDEINEFLLKT